MNKRLEDALNALIEFCDAIDDFAYHSDLPKSKELRKKAETLRESAEQVLAEAK